MRQIQLVMLVFAALAMSACGKQKEAEVMFAEPEVGFRAQGNEPFWTVVVQENSLLYKTPEHLSGEMLAATIESKQGAWVYTAEWEEQPFVLTVTQEACEDDMSGWQFNYTTTLDVAGSTYKGCGNAIGEEYGEP